MSTSQINAQAKSKRNHTNDVNIKASNGTYIFYMRRYKIYLKRHTQKGI